MEATVHKLLILYDFRKRIYTSKSDHRRFVHFLTRCGAFTVRPERSGAKAKTTGLALSLLFNFAAGAATLRANG